LFTFRLQGNPLCSSTNLDQFCGSKREDENNSQSSTNTTSNCQYQGCPPPYEHNPTSPVPCFCAAPLLVGYRLKSPGFIDFRPYRNEFEQFLTSTLELFPYQLHIDSFAWEEGPRLRMYLKIFPAYDENSHIFNGSEVQRIMNMFISWKIKDPEAFGPYEVRGFTDSNDGLSQNPYLSILRVSLVEVGINAYLPFKECATFFSISFNLYLQIPLYLKDNPTHVASFSVLLWWFVLVFVFI
jgi:hypothetical protein